MASNDFLNLKIIQIFYILERTSFIFLIKPINLTFLENNWYTQRPFIEWI